jgi:hypothetical protein
MPSTGYSGDLDWSSFTPVDNTGNAYSIFRSGYKNLRFNVPVQKKVTLNAAQAYNLPGLSQELFTDTSLWLALLAFNGLSDPLTDVYPGLTLNVPTKADLVAYIGQSNKAASASVTI